MQKLSMRSDYGLLMNKFMKKNKNILTLSADTTGGTHIKHAAKNFKNRHINYGIAEQNMMASAAGLARVGFIPVVNTYSAFASMRALEMLRTAICLNNANVKIVASHSGLDVGQDGPTHQTLEELGILRSIPNLKILTPVDKYDLEGQMEWMFKYKGPVYLRTIRRKIGTILKKKKKFSIGNVLELINYGNEVVIISLQITSQYSLEAAAALNRKGVKCKVLHISCLKPINELKILRGIGEAKSVFAVEDHNIIGGLGTAISEILVKSNKKVKFYKIGVEDRFGKSGSAEDLFIKFKLDKNSIIKKILKNI